MLYYGLDKMSQYFLRKQNSYLRAESVCCENGCVSVSMQRYSPSD